MPVYIFKMESRYAVVESVKSQWYFSQNKDILEEWYENQLSDNHSSSTKKQLSTVRVVLGVIVAEYHGSVLPGRLFVFQ